MLGRKADAAAEEAARVVLVAALLRAAQVAVPAARVQVAVPPAPVAVVPTVVPEEAATAATEVRAAATVIAPAVRGAKTEALRAVRTAVTEVNRIAAPETAVVKVAVVTVPATTPRKVLLVIAKAIGTGTAIETETVIVIERGIETGPEIWAAIFVTANAIEGVTKGGGENVSVATSIPRVCMCRRTMGTMDTVQTRMTRAIGMASTRARTMPAAGRLTIRNARTSTSMAPEDFYPSSAVRLRTAWLIAMVSCAVMKKDTCTTNCILPAGAFTGNFLSPPSAPVKPGV